MRRADEGVISGSLRSISIGMVYGHPGLPNCLTLHNQMIPAPLQSSFSGCSSQRGGTLSRPAEDISVDATQRQSAPHPERPVVPDVPDNKRPGRRMMVGTRTTARDWQWLDEMMAEDTPAVRPISTLGGCPRAMDVGEGGEAVEVAGRGLTRCLHSRVRVVPAPVMHIMRGQAHRAWLDGLSSPGFQQMIDEILLPGNGGYRPEFDGMLLDGSQVHLNLNEHVSGLSQAFMALGGTPPSAHVPSGS
ncbi:hypothetical protein PIB30_082530 [Stylosanthes scabra]|uniref:Uncharacterized protein n=1 Tax=Stylosanthes scabra TaxID=79078 RepID=A0ABU6XQK5_9FABA|nr:hypothetical protein [Stylosanthes scabra]